MVDDSIPLIIRLKPPPYLKPVLLYADEVDNNPGKRGRSIGFKLLLFGLMKFSLSLRCRLNETNIRKKQGYIKFRVYPPPQRRGEGVKSNWIKLETRLVMRKGWKGKKSKENRRDKIFGDPKKPLSTAYMYIISCRAGFLSWLWPRVWGTLAPRSRTRGSSGCTGTRQGTSQHS